MITKKTFAVGVDLGATTIKSGIVDPKGKILDQFAVDTMAHKGPQTVIQQLNFSIQELLRKHKPAECAGIGIGSPGVVSITEGTVQYPPNFANWIEVPLARVVRKSFPQAVFIENDANCAAIAEARYGAGIEFKDFIFVIWGTGVGGGIVLDRKIYHGPHGGAGEIGHVSIDYNGQVCNCGNRGCVESYIGQRYLSQRTMEIIKHQPKSGTPSLIEKLVDGNLSRIEPAVISLASEQGDPTAIDILTEAGELLGAALSSAMNMFDLRVAIIGGGISAAPKFVFDAVERSIKSRVLKPHRPGIRVIRSVLGNTAGIIGAASLAM